MSDDTYDSGETLRFARSIGNKLDQIRDGIPSATDIAAFEAALDRAMDSLEPDSVTAALRAEDASHITARLDLVIAFANELHIATALLAEIAEKVRRDASEIAATIEMPDDHDL